MQDRSEDDKNFTTRPTLSNLGGRSILPKVLVATVLLFSSLTLLRGGWSGHTVLWEDWDEGGLPDLEKHKSSHLLLIDRLLRLKR